jgi:predicted TIM-barrel fold metal-dependent hydrolase
VKSQPNMPDLQSLRLFDGCVTLGRIVHSCCPESLTVDSLLRLMDRYEIAEALVHGHHARVRHPRSDGNRRLCDSVRNSPRLHPVWVIEPPARPGRGPARALVDGMLAAGVHAARLPMKTVPPMLWLWEDLLAELDSHHVPCFLDFGDISASGTLSDSDVNGVREIALAHPGLPLVLSNVVGGLGIHPAIVPLTRRTGNLYLDITGVLEYWRTVAVEVTPQRVLFATGMPFTDPGIYVSNVQYGHGLDESAKQLICGGNLRRMLGAVR